METMRTRCDELIASEVAKTTADERFETWQVATHLIARAEERVQ